MRALDSATHNRDAPYVTVPRRNAPDPARNNLQVAIPEGSFTPDPTRHGTAWRNTTLYVAAFTPYSEPRGTASGVKAVTRVAPYRAVRRQTRGVKEP